MKNAEKICQKWDSNPRLENQTEGDESTGILCNLYFCIFLAKIYKHNAYF